MDDVFRCKNLDINVIFMDHIFTWQSCNIEWTRYITQRSRFNQKNGRNLKSTNNVFLIVIYVQPSWIGAALSTTDKATLIERVLRKVSYDSGLSSSFKIKSNWQRIQWYTYVFSYCTKIQLKKCSSMNSIALTKRAEQIAWD